MAAATVDGRSCANQIEARLEPRILALKQAGVEPHLAVVIIGDDAASQVYVAAKQRACERLRIRSGMHSMSPDTHEAELAAFIRSLNEDDSVHGILVQSPLPDGFDELALTDLIDPAKDVDGFHPNNLGRLVQGRMDGLLPCTPAAVMSLLEWSGVSLSGKSAVVIGRSRIVGMPLSLMLGAKGCDATVTVVHSRSERIETHCRTADILVAAVGRAHLVTRDWVKNGAVVIDVGVNRIEDVGDERGWSLAGDVHPEVAETASLLSPVPGGVGPMTIAMLMANTVTATEQRQQR